MGYVIERKSNRRPEWTVAHATRTEGAALDFMAWPVATYATGAHAVRLGVQYRLVAL